MKEICDDNNVGVAGAPGVRRYRLTMIALGALTVLLAVGMVMLSLIHI